jgi:hypothetical protein
MTEGCAPVSQPPQRTRCTLNRRKAQSTTPTKLYRSLFESNTWIRAQETSIHHHVTNSASQDGFCTLNPCRQFDPALTRIAVQNNSLQVIAMAFQKSSIGSGSEPLTCRSTPLQVTDILRQLDPLDGPLFRSSAVPHLVQG